MRHFVLVFAAVGGWLAGGQTPDTSAAEETKFTAQRLSMMASQNRQSFLARFAGKPLDVRGTVVLRDLTNGVATVQLWHGSGQARSDVTCRATDQASLQAAAVLAENQDLRVAGSVSPEASDPRGIVLTPCTILTNNINISPTSELAGPLAKSEAKQGPPTGRYRCMEEDENTFTGWLSVLPRNRYAQPTGEPGRYRFDDKLNRVFFGPGSLAGWQAEFSISSKGRILTMVSPDGTKRRCSWQGE